MYFTVLLRDSLGGNDDPHGKRQSG